MRWSGGYVSAGKDSGYAFGKRRDGHPRDYRLRRVVCIKYFDLFLALSEYECDSIVSLFLNPDRILAPAILCVAV